jgi:sugar lactone lactonase YvrE
LDRILESFSVLERGRVNVGTMSGESIRCVLPWQAIVGESPVWHEQEQCLYWIDIQAKQIHRFHPGSGHNETFDLPEIVTCIALRGAGGLVLTLKKHFAFFDPGTLALERLADVERDIPNNRFNDGKCDPQGRFWAGTMDAVHWSAPAGNLYRFSARKCLATMQTDVICSNGSGWSPDGRTMYYTESFRYAIFAYDFDARDGAIENRRTFVRMDRTSGGFPDGMTVDSDGFVWSNLVGAGQIRRYDPDGKLERIVQLSVPRATDCTFGGPDLTTLYITTARETMTPYQLAEAPLSGSVFAVDCSVRGLPSHAFSG